MSFLDLTRSNAMDRHSARKKSLGLDVPRTSASESQPGIAALFVINFDIKAG